MKRVTLEIPTILYDQASQVVWKHRLPSTEGFLSNMLAAALRRELAEFVEKWGMPREESD